MNINERIFPYPVLSVDKNDYMFSTFNASLEYKKEINSVTITSVFDLKNKEIQKLLDKNLVEYVLHLECSLTSFRTTIKSFVPFISVDVPYSKVNGKLELLAMIVAKQDIYDFYSEDFAEDFLNVKFNLPKASVLAYDNLPNMEFTKNYEDFKKTESIFRIRKIISDEDRKMEVHLDSDKIKILLGQKQYAIFENNANDPRLQQIFHSIVILPSLVYMIGELKMEGGEDYRTHNWYLSLEKAYKNQGKDFEEEILSEKTAIELAQDIMDFPINKAFTKLTNLMNEEE